MRKSISALVMLPLWPNFFNPSASMARAQSIVPMDGTLSNATLPFQSLLSSSPQLSIGRLVAFGLYPIIPVPEPLRVDRLKGLSWF